MKKMMMALMAIFAVTTAFADDDEFKVVEGSFVDVVRQPGKTATVEFNYLDAQAVERTRSDRSLKQLLQEDDPKNFERWDYLMNEAKKFFTERWNEEKKHNLKIVDGKNADYHIIINTTKFDTVTLVLPLGVSVNATAVSSSGANLLFRMPTAIGFVRLTLSTTEVLHQEPLI